MTMNTPRWTFLFGLALLLVTISPSVTTANGTNSSNPSPPPPPPSSSLPSPWTILGKEEISLQQPPFLLPSPDNSNGNRIEFGRSVALSENGKVMVTASPLLDYRWQQQNDYANNSTPTNTDDEEEELLTPIPNPQGGGVFLYRLKENAAEDDEEEGISGGPTWDLVWAMFGETASSLYNNRVGRCLAISPGGNLVGVCDASFVRVFAVSATATTASTKSSLRGGGGETIAASQTTTAFGQPIPLKGCDRVHLELSDNKLMVLSCSGDNNAGQGWVRLYQLNNRKGQWHLVATIKGNNGDDDGATDNSSLPEVDDDYGFGGYFTTSLDPTRIPVRSRRANRLARLAVSSTPYENNNHTATAALRVRVYDIFSDGVAAQVGRDLVIFKNSTGNNELPFPAASNSTATTTTDGGEHFECSLSLSQTSNSVLAISSPQAIHIYAYQRTLQGPSGWKLSQTIPSELETKIALTSDASRLAIANPSHGEFQGMVSIYDNGSGKFKFVSSLVGHHPFEPTDIAMSSSGSILAIGSPFTSNEHGLAVGSVQVLIDQSPFCSTPAENESSNGQVFIERKHCRKGPSLLAKDESECSKLYVNRNGQKILCLWANASPSAGPVSAIPTASPTVATSSPTFSPTTRNPTLEPTPSVTPSFSSPPTTKPSSTSSTWNPTAPLDETADGTSSQYEDIDGESETIVLSNAVWFAMFFLVVFIMVCCCYIGRHYINQ